MSSESSHHPLVCLMRPTAVSSLTGLRWCRWPGEVERLRRTLDTLGEALGQVLGALQR